MNAVTYFALVPFESYNVGDIVPGAASWPYIQFYVAEGKVAPVLVSTLPPAALEVLESHEKVVEAAKPAPKAEKTPRKRAAPPKAKEVEEEPTPFVPVDRAGNPLEPDVPAE